jgi:hypothetical protein
MKKYVILSALMALVLPFALSAQEVDSKSVEVKSIVASSEGFLASCNRCPTKPKCERKCEPKKPRCAPKCKPKPKCERKCEPRKPRCEKPKPKCEKPKCAPRCKPKCES